MYCLHARKALCLLLVPGAPGDHTEGLAALLTVWLQVLGSLGVHRTRLARLSCYNDDAASRADSV